MGPATMRMAPNLIECAKVQTRNPKKPETANLTFLRCILRWMPSVWRGISIGKKYPPNLV